MPSNKRRLLIISLDAVSSGDVETLLKMPNFSSLWRRGTLVTEVSSVFISNTYPAHASIVTGLHPRGHGVIDNLLYQPTQAKPDWRFNRSHIKSTTLFDEARKAGLSTCSILWPLTAGADVTYNLPEIFSERRPFLQPFLSLKYGSPLFQLGMLAKHGAKLFPIGQPSVDNFAVAAACDALMKKKPELTLLHLTDYDIAQHFHGPGSPEAQEALDRHDVRLGHILNALRDADTFDDTGVILLGDHACLPVSRTVDLSLAVKDLKGRAGFLQAGGCAFLKIEDMSDKSLVKEAAALIQGLLTDEGSGVGRLLTREEMEIGGFSGEFVCGVEAANGVCFGTKERLGQHGYGLGRDGYKTFYMASGLDMPCEKRVQGGCIVDICPLALNLLGIAPWEMDGTQKIFPEKGQSPSLGRDAR